MRLHVSVTVDAPADRVYAVASDLDRWADVISQIRRIEVLSDGPTSPLRPGVRFRETRLMFGREASETMDVLEVNEPGASDDGSAGYTLGAESHGSRYRTSLTMTPAGKDRTTLVMDFRGEPLTFAAKLMSPLGKLMVKKMRAMVERDLHDIKRAVETGGERTPGTRVARVASDG